MSATGPADPKQKFDEYAQSYDGLHKQSISASGEPTEYFAEYKLGCLRRLGVGRESAVLDFGCGIGNLTEQLVREIDVVHGFDPSDRSLETCQRRAPSAVLHTSEDAIPDAGFDFAVLSGVLHHVAKQERVDLLRRVAGKLRPGGRVVIFEHNPLNPLTLKAVNDCPFDDDAVLLWPWEVKELVKYAGYGDVRLDYIVFFPRALSPLRPLEPRLRHVLLGAQTMTIATRS